MLRHALKLDEEASAIEQAIWPTVYGPQPRRQPARLTEAILGRLEQCGVNGSRWAISPDFRFRCGTVTHRISSRALIARVPT